MARMVFSSRIILVCFPDIHASLKMFLSKLLPKLQRVSAGPESELFKRGGIGARERGRAVNRLHDDPLKGMELAAEQVLEEDEVFGEAGVVGRVEDVQTL